ncbi:LamG-like jellyroll fold domain-containing protein [Bacillus pseudomycoides]|uniref:LamG-like jellyroll fold domain-containing protein n=1 Tax=Bacillus pseudomycoides TaxID=64104 RepID=UPI000BFBAE68|nr:FN3 and LamG domain-containing metallophosphoesterase family protein [Bacillus pseudomycoides]PHA44173.1 acid phosphatase [Bacillus pseudomycoides]
MIKKMLCKVKDLIGFLAVFFLVFTSFSWTSFAETKEEKTEKESSEKKIVFPVLSDVHIKNSGTDDTFRFQRALQQLNAVAPRQDAFVVVGDFTDSGSTQQYDRFFQTYKQYGNQNATAMYALGNHDYWNGLLAHDAQQRFLKKTGMESIYYHKVVKGYHFLVMSPENGVTHGYYSDTQINWLKQELVKAKQADPNNPIFVFLHQQIKGTVYGSHEWGANDSAKINEVLKEYPQAVTFSGHSHYPLDDPRSIHQKDFTSVGTSSVSYMEVESGKVQGNIPPGAETLSQGLLVEVDDQKVTIHRRDFHTNSWTGEPWVVELPAKKESFKYTEDRDKEKPTFLQDAKLKLSNITETSVTATFPQAVDNLLVHSYRLQAKEKATGKVKNHILAFSEFYRDPVPKELTFTLGGLEINMEYNIEVTALDSFGNESSAPLREEFETNTEVIDPNAKVPKADVFDVNFLDGTFKDYSSFGANGSVKGDVAIEYEKPLKKQVMKLSGRNNTYGYIPFSNEQKEKVKDSFTLEAVFSMNQIRNQAIMENTESGGIGFESTGSGYVELWAHIGGSYKRIGVQLEANKTYHLTGTYNGSELALYVDGKKVNSLRVTGKVYHPNVPFAIGADPTSSGNGDVPLNGKIVLARLYSKALTPSEVKAAYNEFNNRIKIEEIHNLYEEMNKVNETLAGTYEFGEKPGQYSQKAFAALQKAYNGAKETFERMMVTKEEIVTMYQSLQTAHQTFLHSKVAEEKPQTAKEKLQVKINRAKDFLTKIQVGTEVGQYMNEPVKALEQKIQVAEVAVRDQNMTDQRADSMQRTLEDATVLVENSINK